MKEISEYTSEVLRRAEEKNRTRRRNIGTAISFCVPFALLSAAAVFVLPRLGLTTDSMPGAAALPEDAESHYVDSDSISAEPGQAAIYASIESLDEEQGGEASLVCGEPDKLAALIESIESAEADPPADESFCRGWRITLTDAEGNISSYLLTELRLRNNVTGAEYALTAEQYERLLELIGK